MIEATKIIQYIFISLALNHSVFSNDYFSPEGEAKRSAYLDNSEQLFQKALLAEHAKSIREAHGKSIEALKTSLSNIDLQVNWVAQNLANANTPGYKAIWIMRDFPMGKFIPRIDRDFRQGALAATGNKFDLAISGPGFFRLTDAQGRAIFHRWGSFKVSGDRYLTDLRGNLLLPKIQIPSNLEEDTFSVTDRGVITMTTKQGKKVPLGTIQFFEPLLAEKLHYTEDCNCFYIDIKETDKLTTIVQPSDSTAVNQGFIEMSNVDLNHQRTAMLVLLQHRTTVVKALKMLQALPQKRL